MIHIGLLVHFAFGAANRDQPVGQGSTIQLTLDGWLGFTDSEGLQTWIYNETNGVNSGAMLDTGNFILVDSVSSILWQSFDDPIDTLLPGQTFGEEKYLYSNLLEGDYRTDRFMLVMQNDGNLVLHPQGRRGLDPNGAYYATSTNGASSPVHLVDQVIANVSSNALNSPEKFYQRATTDSDDFFRRYSRPRNSNNGESWTVVSRSPDDKDACGVPGACPGCHCPQKLSFIDPNYPFDGCKQDFNTGCLDYKASDYTFAEHYVDKDNCKMLCMNDCLCDVAIARNIEC
ncbi:hypothetical protein AMTRI_Chr03g44530 [Amborella trichopoda]